MYVINADVKRYRGRHNSCQFFRKKTLGKAGLFTHVKIAVFLFVNVPCIFFGVCFFLVNISLLFFVLFLRVCFVVVVVFFSPSPQWSRLLLHPSR